MKGNESHVSHAPLHGSLGRTQYFLISPSSVLQLCSYGNQEILSPRAAPSFSFLYITDVARRKAKYLI